MIWQSCRIIGNVETGKDALNNPKYTSFTVSETHGRITQWSIEDTNSLGYKFTSTHRKILLWRSVSEIRGNLIEWDPFNFEEDYFIDCEPDKNQIEINGERYEVTKIFDLQPRYRLAYIKAAKL